jgi:hypothetical protein
MIRKMLLTLALLPAFGWALGAESYPSVSSLQGISFYRLTCTSLTSDPQISGYFEVENGKVEVLKLVTVYPALSLNVTDFSSKDLRGIQLKLSKTSLVIEGEREGAYFPETLSLRLRDQKGKITGTLKYDDGDGVQFERPVNCGALNYILQPNS